jgi:uncharacterized protein YodC (DUF2158 family)
MQFEPGDIVQLKSGGPKMTISEIIDGDEAICQWFVQDKRCEETFETVTLTKIKE